MRKSKGKRKQKKINGLLVGFIVLIGLVVVWFFSSFFQDGGYQLPEIKKMTFVTKIELRKGVGELVTIVFTNSNWIIPPDGYIADKNVVEDMVDKIKNFSLSDLVSRGGNLASFNLDENNRVEVKAYEGDNLSLHFYMGKTSPTFRHTYVMINGDRNIYQAKGNFNYLFDRSPDSIKSMTMCTIPSEEVENIEITEGGRKYTVKKIMEKGEQTNKESIVWKASWKKENLEKEKWEDFLRKITPLSASGVKKGVFNEKEGFIRKIEIRSAKEKVVIFILKQDKDKTYVAGVRGNPALFQLSEQRGKELLTEMGKF